jgi:hypothetical protein
VVAGRIKPPKTMLQAKYRIGEWEILRRGI